MFLLLYLFCMTIRFVHSNEENNPQNKTAVVTGAAQGIGFAIADHFFKTGVKFVIILDNQFEKGTQAAKTLNDKHGATRAIFIYCDVTKNLEEVSSRILREYKYIDIFVNDAGVVNEFCPEVTINTNNLALIQWALKFWQHMRKDRGGIGGTIINLSSIIGYYIMPLVPVYTASKYAVLGFSKNLGHEYTYRNTHVRVLTLCPGFTNTAFLRNPKASAEQIELFHNILNNSQIQEADDVGRGAVQVYKTAKSGTAWVIIGGNDPVKGPTSQTLTAAEIDSFS